VISYAVRHGEDITEWITTEYSMDGDEDDDEAEGDLLDQTSTPTTPKEQK
jgi:hypothetical protein